MFLFTTSKRLIKAVFLDLVRSGFPALVPFLVMVLTLFTASVLASVSFYGEKALSFFESRGQLTAFFKDEATESRILEHKEKLEAGGLVSEVRYVSKEEALKIFAGFFQGEPQLLEGISANVLPASLEIRVKNLSELETVAAQVSKLESIEEVRFSRDVFARLASLLENLRLLGVIMIVFLGVVTILIVWVTIALTIYSRREEIEIQKLVGASDWYVRLPFLVEGVLYGVLASGVSVGTLFLLLPSVLPQLALSFLNIFDPPPTSFYLTLLFYEALLGSVLGVVGSFAAILKYLK